MQDLAFNFESKLIGRSRIIHADCFEWLGKIPENSFHAIVTDPPYGVKEYDFDQLLKRANGNGGIWRIQPCSDGQFRPGPAARMSSQSPALTPGCGPGSFVLGGGGHADSSGVALECSRKRRVDQAPLTEIDGRDTVNV
jgi:hypothetical protein